MSQGGNTASPTGGTNTVGGQSSMKFTSTNHATGGNSTVDATTVVPLGGASSVAGSNAVTGGSSSGSVAQGGASAVGGMPATGGNSVGGNATGGSSAIDVANAIFVAPDGKDSNPGTLAQPYLTLAKAATRAAPNVTIYMRGGTYNYATMVTLSSSGTAAAPIRILAYGSEKPALDFSTQPYGSANRAILLTGNYWQIQGLEIRNAGDNGLKLEGSHNRIERCVFHHNGDGGIQLGFAHETANPNGENCAYNEIVNCD